MKPVKHWEIVRRSFAEAKGEVRLDTPVRFLIAIVAPIISGFLVWWLSGNWTWTGVTSVCVLLAIGLFVFVVKLFTVPLAMLNEARSLIPIDQPREVDGIYQFGELVGRAVGANRITGAYQFYKIIDVGGFDPNREFEYKNVVLYNNATNYPVRRVEDQYFGVVGELVGSL